MEVEGRMIKLVEKAGIIKKYYEGKKVIEISRELGLNRGTVSKYIKEYERLRKEIEEQETNSEEIDIKLIEKLSEKPKAKIGKRPKKKLTEKIQKRLGDYIEINEERKLKKQIKQLMNVEEMHRQLIEEGYEIGKTTVYNYVREFTEKTREAYIRQEYLPGEVVEFDWGELKIEIAEKMKRLQLALFTTAYSDNHYGLIYEKQNTESFIDSHIKYFNYLGKVPLKIVYDNMRVAVKTFVGTEKEPTEALLKLETHYVFDHRFCNARRGNEKGHVENGVGYVRARAFSYKASFNTIEEAQEHLNEVLEKINSEPKKQKEGKSSKELLEIEKNKMRVKSPDFEYSVMKTLRADKYSTITIDTCKYSVPDEYAQKHVKVKLYATKIKIYSKEGVVAEHERLYAFNKWVINIEHYCRTLKRKPGAIAGSTALHQAPKKLVNIYNEYYTTKPKDFIDLIEFMKNKEIKINEIEETIKTLKTQSIKEIDTSKIKVILERKEMKINETTIAETSRNQIKKITEMMVI